MRWAKYRGWRLLAQSREGECVRIRLRFDAEEEALQFALSFGGDLRVVEPVELQNRVLRAARAIAEIYLPGGR